MAKNKIPIFRGMSEDAIREYVVAFTAKSLGIKEGSTAHRLMVDIYNAHSPLARGYALKYNDAWCAAFVSYVAISLGITDIIPTEVGCGPMIELFKKLGRWQEKDNYVPRPGDVIFYDWEDDGAGDNTGAPNHVGLVEKVTDGWISVIEGNKDNAVGRRKIKVNGRYIRGFGMPDYASLVWGFSDVPEGEWYTPAVDWAEDLGIVEGVTERVFAPATACTRAEAVTMLWRLAGSPEMKNAAQPFQDVADGAYYTAAVRWAHDAGITVGITDTTFGPDEPCNRAQIVTMIHRAAGCPAGEMLSPFADVYDCEWFSAAVDWAYAEGVAKGINDYQFAPEAACTRAEMVTFLYRARSALNVP